MKQTNAKRAKCDELTNDEFSSSPFVVTCKTSIKKADDYYNYKELSFVENSIYRIVVSKRDTIND